MASTKQNMTAIYFGNNPAANATAYLLDLKDGGVTPLVKTPAKYGGYNDGYWSPDSKLIVVTSSIKDVDGAHYKNQVTTIDTTVKSTKTEVIAENVSTAAENPKNFYSATSWSSDGRYITFVQNNQLHYYDLGQKKLLPDVIAPDSGIANVNGWITQT
jgi:dipeptidyl aminopeptidase/acylaminoacyl peptidase